MHNYPAFPTDDLKTNHVDPKVNNKFLAWLKTKCADDKIGEIKAVRAKKHNYLVITFDFMTLGLLKQYDVICQEYAPRISNQV
jgi:hypothetical protein